MIYLNSLLPVLAGHLRLQCKLDTHGRIGLPLHPAAGLALTSRTADKTNDDAMALRNAAMFNASNASTQTKMMMYLPLALPLPQSSP